jgi:lipopolysaccharide biosynthesis protein
MRLARLAKGGVKTARGLQGMTARLLQRLRILLRFALPGPRALLYLYRIRRSRLFDRQYYRDTNPELHPLFRAFPERHYVLFGEAEGRAPRSDFMPRTYLRHNPDLASWAGEPFQHYVLYGHLEARQTRALPHAAGGLTMLPPALRRDPTAAPRDLAAVVHLYYPDLWPEIVAALRASKLEMDLFVTLTHRPEKADEANETDPDSAETEPESGGLGIHTPLEEIAARITADWPGARVIAMPNHGRDIFPFVHLVNSGLLDPYRAICKIHTKRSPHRQDGEAWRRHLIAGILPGAQSGALLDRFLADRAAGVWVADGQHYTDARWWGSNRDGVARLLRRVGVRTDPDRLSFPAGSIYWIKPLLLTMIRGLRLGLHDFEPEFGQLDGTTAHAFERVLGGLTEAADLEIRQTAQLEATEPAPTAPHARASLVSAFYLPQFHRTPQNDDWWGPGYTEWMAAARARPIHDGQDQPVLPDDLGFYDLRQTEVMGEQAALARGAGINAFCVYHYWFDGRRILEAPMQNLLARPEVDFPFYLCWANESWRRNWDGLSGEVLLEQGYAPGFEAALAADIAPYMRDPRYLRPDGTRPRLVIYRPEDMPEPARNIARLRAALKDLGIGPVEMGAVRFHVEGAHPVASDLFDFWIEMPPHGLVDGGAYLYGGPQGNRLGFDPVPGFQGLIYDYGKVIRNSLSPEYAARLPANTIAGVMPSWDNTARRGLRAHLAFGAHPAAFRRWLYGLSEHRLATSYRGEVMINAWNEWAEKAMLEPGGAFGRANLDMVREWR